MRVRELYKLIKKACIRETSYFPKRWSKSNPCYGQCCMIALAVNEFCGAEIYRTIAKLRGRKVYHYFNRNRYGRVIDLSVIQFTPEERFDNICDFIYYTPTVKFRDPKDLLRQGAVRARYEIFRNRICQEIAQVTIRRVREGKPPLVWKGRRKALV